MAEQASGSVHLMLGLNASRVPNNTKLHYCPICIQQQREIMESISGIGLGFYLTFQYA
jgi:hypothetical protein